MMKTYHLADLRDTEPDRALPDESTPTLRAITNDYPALRTRIEHVVPLGPCCPVSHNPKEGSSLTIRYRASGKVLEVYSLKQYLKLYVGGHPDGTRNMEAMVQHIAQDCADTLGVGVFVHAHLLLQPDQEMRLSVVARAICQESRSTSADRG